MTTVLNISEAVSLGLHAMGYLAERPDEIVPSAAIAKSLGVSGAHLQKVLQRLSRAGLVESRPGPRGGFALAKPANRIRLLDIYREISGPLKRQTCLLGKPRCNGRCMLGGLIGRVNDEVADYLKNTRLSDVVSAKEAGGRT